MIKALLPESFKHKTVQQLVRLGKPNHGGFLVAPKDIENSELLISLGLTEEWSFERDFVTTKQMPVLAYGRSVGKRYLTEQFFRSLLSIHKPKLVWYWLRTLINYRKFFLGDNTHIEQLIGPKFSENYTTMQEVFDSVDAKNIYLKIDIEGNEYRILDDLICNQTRITGLVIEFHDCDIHIQRIQEFIEAFSLSVIHIHANNYAPVRVCSGLPLVLDMTFSASQEAEADCVYPHPLDMPNNPEAAEIKIFFTA